MIRGAKIDHLNISGAELARAAGVTRQEVQRLYKVGVLVRQRDFEFDLCRRKNLEWLKIKGLTPEAVFEAVFGEPYEAYRARGGYRHA